VHPRLMRGECEMGMVNVDAERGTWRDGQCQTKRKGWLFG
jgi:hypothetical protein